MLCCGRPKGSAEDVDGVKGPANREGFTRLQEAGGPGHVAVQGVDEGGNDSAHPTTPTSPWQYELVIVAPDLSLTAEELDQDEDEVAILQAERQRLADMRSKVLARMVTRGLHLHRFWSDDTHDSSLNLCQPGEEKAPRRVQYICVAAPDTLLRTAAEAMGLVKRLKKEGSEHDKATQMGWAAFAEYSRATEQRFEHSTVGGGARWRGAMSGGLGHWCRRCPWRKSSGEGKRGGGKGQEPGAVHRRLTASWRACAGIFTSLERIRIIFHLIESAPYVPPGGADVDLDGLVARGVFRSYFCLQNRRKTDRLRELWLAQPYLVRPPLGVLRDYLGEKVALYFAW